MDLSEAQRMMMEIYGKRDMRRGAYKTFLWLVEEVGELANALRDGDGEGLKKEFADVLAWLFSLANVVGVDVNQAFIDKYNFKCPKCGFNPCICEESR